MPTGSKCGGNALRPRRFASLPVPLITGFAAAPARDIYRWASPIARSPDNYSSGVLSLPPVRPRAASLRRFKLARKTSARRSARASLGDGLWDFSFDIRSVMRILAAAVSKLLVLRHHLGELGFRSCPSSSLVAVSGRSLGRAPCASVSSARLLFLGRRLPVPRAVQAAVAQW